MLPLSANDLVWSILNSERMGIEPQKIADTLKLPIQSVNEVLEENRRLDPVILDRRKNGKFVDPKANKRIKHLAKMFGEDLDLFHRTGVYSTERE